MGQGRTPLVTLVCKWACANGSEPEPVQDHVSLGTAITNPCSGHRISLSSCDVPSSTTLDHGDLLVMDGSVQSEYAHRTVLGLQGPRVLLTYRWVTQHAASCPQAGVVGCVLPTCVQGLVEPSSRWLGEGENKWTSSWGLVLLFLIMVFALLVSTWIHTRRGHRYSLQRLSRRRACFPSRGSARWVGRRRWQLSRRRQYSKRASFYFSLVFFWERKLYSFSQSLVSYFCSLLGSPPHATMMHVHHKTTFLPFFGRFFLVSKRTFFFLGGYCMDTPYWEGQASWAWTSGFHPWSTFG